MFEVLKKFNLLADVDTVDRFGRGDLNRSYLVNTKIGSNYVLQLIDNKIFKKPEDVIENIEQIITYTNTLSEDLHLNLNVKILKCDNNKFVRIDGTYWRCYKLDEDTRILKKIVNKKMIYEVGQRIGHFHKCTKDFSAEELNVTLPDFHNTYKHYQKLENYVFEDKIEESIPLFNETKFIIDRKEDLKLITKLLKTKAIPLRVTHNNLRLNNMLLDDNSYKVIAIIGFDAIMPGSLLYDFGDALRYFASTTREDENNLDLVKINIEFFKEFTRGYLEEVISFITDKEEEHLIDAYKIMTLENGIIHLTDYINGNKKYKTEYKEQNLDRARNQFKLVSEIELHYDELKKIVTELKNEILFK